MADHLVKPKSNRKTTVQKARQVDKSAQKMKDRFEPPSVLNPRLSIVQQEEVKKFGDVSLR